MRWSVTERALSIEFAAKMAFARPLLTFLRKGMIVVAAKSNKLLLLSMLKVLNEGKKG